MEVVYDERVNIKLNFYGELIDYAINSDYLSFLKDLCGIFGLSMNQLSAISLSYQDEDGDVIMVSTKEDFAIFLEQAKQKVVDTLIVEVKEESNIDPISLMDSALNYQEQVEEANANLVNSNQNNINNDNNYYNNNNYDDYYNIQNQEVNNEAPLVFYVECNKCQIYPLLERIYYCQQCDMCLCDECKIRNENHEHPLLKIETEDDFEIIKKAYADRAKLVEKNNNEPFNNINYPNSQNNNINNINQNYNNPNYNNQNYNNQNNINQNNGNYNNYYPPPNYQYIPPSNSINRNISHNIFQSNRMMQPSRIPFLLKPFEKLSKKAIKHIEKNKRRRKIENNYRYQHEIKKMIKEARENYDLNGIEDQQIINALYKTNGNLEQAIILLTQ